MSLLRSIITNRLNQITCLVIPKYQGVIGRRLLATERNIEEIETQGEEQTSEKGDIVIEDQEINYNRLNQDEIFKPGVYFPTLDIFETTYDGIKYEDLPYVRIVLTRNNVKMGAHSADGNITYGTKTCDMVRKKIKHCRVELVGTTMSRLPALIGIQQAGINIVSISDRTNHSFYTRPRHPKK